MSINEVLTIQQIQQATQMADYVLQHANPDDCAAIAVYGDCLVNAKLPTNAIRGAFVEAAIRALPNTADVLLSDMYTDESAAFLNLIARTVYKCRKPVTS